MEYHLIGDPFNERPQIFELRLSDHITDVCPDTYKITDPKVPSIDPNDYFVTSGDAVKKAKKMDTDLWAKAGEVRRYRGSKATKKYQKYEKAVWKAAGEARKLIRKLIEARGDACFLETEWRNHVLLCIPKNPRKRT